VRRNNIYNIPSCDNNSAAIYCDRGGTDWIWEYNYIHDSIEGSTASFKGLFVEANCADTTIRYNLVANVGGYGLQTRDSADPNTTASAAKFYRNTVYDSGEACLYIRDGSDLHASCTGGGPCVDVQGNLFVQTRNASDFIDVFEPNVHATPAEWDTNRNWYYHSGTNNTPFETEKSPNADLTFTQWQNTYNTDQQSTNGSNPQFAAETGTSAGDFLNLNTGSPAIDGCGTSAALGPYVGGGHDCGFAEAPIFDAAQTTTSATTVVVTYETIHGDLTHCTASRFEIDASVTGNNRVPTSATPAGNQVTLTLSTPLSGSDTITVSALRNACRTVFIPNTPMAVGTAAFTNQPVTNNLGGPGPDPDPDPDFGTWVSGASHTAPAGTNRLLLVGFCWSQQVTPDMDITAPAYGGQSCTIIESQRTAVGTAQTLAVLAYCDEADITAAASSTITYATSETPSETRPVIVGSAFYEHITQVGPITDSDSATATDVTSLSTPDLTTTNPGVAVSLGCANGAVTWSPGSGWEEQLDVCEDGTCGHRLLAQDRDTTGAIVTPAATLSATSARVSLVSASLNGGEAGQNPGDLILEQVAYRGHEWRALSSEASFQWLGPTNGPIHVVPDGKFSLIVSYKAQQESETIATAKVLLCSDNGGELYIPGDTHGTNALAMIASPVWSDQSAISTRLLSVPAGGDAFIPGVRHGSAAQVANQLPTVNDYSEREYSLWLSPTASPGPITCQLGLADGTALECQSPQCPAMITVVPGRALGF
jgi:hypothetical protein